MRKIPQSNDQYEFDSPVFLFFSEIQKSILVNIYRFHIFRFKNSHRF